MNTETLQSHVNQFIKDVTPDELYFVIGEGVLDVDGEYINKKSLIFTVHYYRKYDDTCCGSDLVHAVKKSRGYQLINANPTNWYPSKDNCLAYRFISEDE